MSFQSSKKIYNTFLSVDFPFSSLIEKGQLKKKEIPLMFLSFQSSKKRYIHTHPHLLKNASSLSPNIIQMFFVGGLFCRLAANITLALNFKGHLLCCVFSLCPGFSEAFQKLKSQILNFSGNFSPC